MDPNCNNALEVRRRCPPHTWIPCLLVRALVASCLAAEPLHQPPPPPPPAPHKEEPQTFLVPAPREGGEQYCPPPPA